MVPPMMVARLMPPERRHGTEQSLVSCQQRLVSIEGKQVSIEAGISQFQNHSAGPLGERAQSVQSTLHTHKFEELHLTIHVLDILYFLSCFIKIYGIIWEK